MELPLAQIPPAISLSWEEAAAIMGIVTAVFGAIAAVFGLRFVSKGIYYATREADEKARLLALDAARSELLKEIDSTCVRIGRLETAAEVLSAGQLKTLSDGLSDVRAELSQGRASREQLATVLMELKSEVALLRVRGGPRRRSRPDAP